MMKCISVYVCLHLTCILMIYGHLLPEDSPDDNAEQLYREKRQNFLSNILKTIPFFNLSPAQSELLTDEDDPNDVEDDAFFPSEPILSPSKVLSTLGSSFMMSSTLSPPTSTVLSATVAPSATIFSSALSQLSKTPSLTLASSYTSTNKTTSKLLTSQVIATTSTYSASKTTLKIEPTSSTRMELMSTPFTYPSASSAVKIMPSSAKISATSATITMISSPVQDELPSVINMMIMSAEDSMQNPKLPDESGYGNTVHAQREQEEDELKNMHYLYSNVLIPVISGLFGAMLITFGIIVYKCVRRSKLKKIRYYGGKPESALYRLDQMSLLAELSSDDED